MLLEYNKAVQIHCRNLRRDAQRITGRLFFFHLAMVVAIIICLLSFIALKLRNSGGRDHGPDMQSTAKQSSPVLSQAAVRTGLPSSENQVAIYLL